jgi:hypothetical protein
MKSLINSQPFDTSTAELVHLWDNGLDTTDFAYRTEALYRAANGMWFIHHCVGPSSDSRADMERIVPILPDRARECLLQHGGSAVVETYFPRETGGA